MRFIKRLFCLAAAAALALSVMLTSAYADSEGYTFVLNETKDGYIVTGYTGQKSTITVPDWHQSLPVTGIGAAAFQGNTALTQVSLPSTITVIGRAAFKNCSSLSTITSYTAADQPPEGSRLPGDADKNGQVDIYDAILIMKHGAGWNVTLEAENADVNASGGVNMDDVLLILQYAAGKDVTLR